MSLILDSSHSSKITPVNGIFCRGFIRLSDKGVHKAGFVTIEALLLGIGPGRHKVVTDGEVLVGSVDSVDLSIEKFPDGLTEVELLNSSIREAIIGNVFHESLHD